MGRRRRAVVLAACVGACGPKTSPLDGPPAAILATKDHGVVVATAAGVAAVQGKAPILSWGRDGVVSSAIGDGVDGLFVAYLGGQELREDARGDRYDARGLFLRVGENPTQTLIATQPTYVTPRDPRPDHVAVVATRTGFVLVAAAPTEGVKRSSLLAWALDSAGKLRQADPAVLMQADESLGVESLSATPTADGTLVAAAASSGGRDARVWSVVLEDDATVRAPPAPLGALGWTVPSLSDAPIDGHHLLCGDDVGGQTHCARLDNKGALLDSPVELQANTSSGSGMRNKSCGFKRVAILAAGDRWLVAHCLTKGYASTITFTSSFESRIRLATVAANGSDVGELKNKAAAAEHIGHILGARTGESATLVWGEGSAGAWLRYTL